MPFAAPRVTRPPETGAGAVSIAGRARMSARRSTTPGSNRSRQVVAQASPIVDSSPSAEERSASGFRVRSRRSSSGRPRVRWRWPRADRRSPAPPGESPAARTPANWNQLVVVSERGRKLPVACRASVADWRMRLPCRKDDRTLRRTGAAEPRSHFPRTRPNGPSRPEDPPGSGRVRSDGGQSGGFR